MFNKVFIVIAITTLLVGCTAGPASVQAKYQPLFSFADVASYGLYNRNEAFNDYQSLSDAFRNDIELAIERTMDEKGYQFKDQEQADVILTYYWLKQDMREFKAYNHGINFCSYCLNHSGSNSKADRLKIRPNTLIIDALNRKTKRSVWRSYYPLTIKEKENSQQTQAKIRQAVTIMLDKFGKN